jgi:hypothetical protein
VQTTLIPASGRNLSGRRNCQAEVARPEGRAHARSRMKTRPDPVYLDIRHADHALTPPIVQKLSSSARPRRNVLTAARQTQPSSCLLQREFKRKNIHPVSVCEGQTAATAVPAGA